MHATVEIPVKEVVGVELEWLMRTTAGIDWYTDQYIFREIWRWRHWQEKHLKFSAGQEAS